MTFEEYERRATATAQYPQPGANLVYPALGLVGEAGEVAEKIKKHYRATGTLGDESMAHDQRMALMFELGDVLWYVAALARELGVRLEYVAQRNLDKLHDRVARGVIKGEGDAR